MSVTIKDMKYYGNWSKQLKEVKEDIERLETGKFSWYSPNFYYSSEKESDILKEALQLKNRIEKDLAQLDKFNIEE